MAYQLQPNPKLTTQWSKKIFIKLLSLLIFINKQNFLNSKKIILDKNH